VPGASWITAARFDYRSGLSVMRSHEMQDKLSPVVRQCFELRIHLYVRQGTELMSVPAENRLIDRPARLGERAGETASLGFARRLEGALPARCFLALVVQAGAVNFPSVGER
jgi:hypothetical protein